MAYRHEIFEKTLAAEKYARYAEKQIADWNYALFVLKDVKESRVWHEILPEKVGISAGWMHNHGADCGIEVHVEDHSQALELLERINMHPAGVESAMLDNNEFVSMPWAIAENKKRPYKKLTSIGYGYASLVSSEHGSPALWMTCYFKTERGGHIVKLHIEILKMDAGFDKQFYGVIPVYEEIRGRDGKPTKRIARWQALPSPSFGKCVRLASGDNRIPPRIVYYDDLGPHSEEEVA